jgi:hypothetical protein
MDPSLGAFSATLVRVVRLASPMRAFASLTKTRLVSAKPGQDAAYLVAEARRAALRRVGDSDSAV